MQAAALSVDGAFPGGQVTRVAVPGGELVVEVAGCGPAIVLLHGWTLDRRQWRGQGALADRFTLVAIDRRGFGGSRAPPDLAEEPDDVARVAAALGLERYHLVGLSQGGKVALAHASTGPEGLERLVVIGAPLDIKLAVTPESVPVAEMAALARAGRLDAMRQLWLAHPLTAGRPEVRAALAAMLARYDGRDLVAPGRPLTVTLDDVRRIAVPATALAGADDTPWRRAVAAALAEAGFASALIPGGGHLAPMDAAQATNAALLAALG
jgi:pimeloyl-ACP methyl ester carboxylesterase